MHQRHSDSYTNSNAVRNLSMQQLMAISLLCALRRYKQSGQQFLSIECSQHTFGLSEGILFRAIDNTAAK